MPRTTNSSSTKAMAKVSKANADFAVKWYPELVALNGKEENLVASPFSASAVLTMVMAGARGNTKAQLRDGLCHRAEDQIVCDGYKEVLGCMESGEGFTLEVANKLYLEQEYPFVEGFLDITRNSFKADAERVDFQEKYDAVREHINDFVSKKTNGKINDLISEESVCSLTRMVLVNALYFKGTWGIKFDPSLTKKKPFKFNANTIDASTVTQTVHV